MRSKYIFLALLCVAAIFLTGCDNKTVYKDGTAEVKRAGIAISFPEGWTVGVNDEAYEVIGAKVDMGDANEIKEMYENIGVQILLSARSSDESVTVTLMQLGKGEMNAEEQLRLQHENTLLNFRSLNFFIESSIVEHDWGGVSGWLSVIAAFDEEGGSCITEGRQFYFERGESVFALITESVGGSKEDSESIDISLLE